MATVAKIILIILNLGCCVQLLAQSNDRAELATILKKVAARYNRNQHLSFQVKYMYHNAGSKEVTDSVEGEMKTFNNNYSCIIDNTETIKKDSIILSLFKEDKLIHMAKSTVAATLSNPVVVIDSLLKTIDNLGAEISHNAQAMVLRFRQSAAGQMEITFNSLTGYISVVKYWLPGTGNNHKLGGQDMVEANFFNYLAGNFGDGVFDLSKYIIKTNSGYKLTDAYREYTLFIGSPNL